MFIAIDHTSFFFRPLSQFLLFLYCAFFSFPFLFRFFLLYTIFYRIHCLFSFSILFHFPRFISFSCFLSRFNIFICSFFLSSVILIYLHFNFSPLFILFLFSSPLPFFSQLFLSTLTPPPLALSLSLVLQNIELPPLPLSFKIQSIEAINPRNIKDNYASQ